MEDGKKYYRVFLRKSRCNTRVYKAHNMLCLLEMMKEDFDINNIIGVIEINKKEIEE